MTHVEQSPPPRTLEALEELLSRPTTGAIEAIAQCPGDIVVLGAGGKMGPTLARMVRRALDALGRDDEVIAVSRFGDPRDRDALHHHDVRTVRADLVSASAYPALPDAPNVIYLVGQKFGTSSEPGRTWLTNVVAAALTAERYAGSRIVALSTGNVYPLVPVESGGASERTPPAPAGEYAWSCLGRERVFADAAARRDTRLAIVRLNYAHDLRYGVLTDIATTIAHDAYLALDTGHANVIWQGDANARVLQCLPHASTGPFIINVTGADTIEVRRVALAIADRVGRAPRFTGTPAPTALLSDASRSFALFGDVQVDADTLIAWTADWVVREMPLLEKPTHFEARDGAY